jgi:hypothetical protein
MPNMQADIQHDSPRRHRLVAMFQRLTSSGYVTMQDAVNVAALRPGFGAYVGYTDGDWPTLSEVEARFPGSPILSLTTGLGSGIGIDVEVGNVGWDDGCAAVPGWVRGKLDEGVSRPVVYIGASDGYFIIDKLAANGISRDQFRLFTAHWTNTAHVCGPSVCGNAQADATQYSGNVGGLAYGYDLSLLAPGFFSSVPTPTPTPTPPPAPPKPKPVPEEFMKVVIVTTPSKSNSRPVFVLWGGTKRWMINEAMVNEWLTLAGQTEPMDLGSAGWTEIVGPVPDAPNSTPVPGQ